MRSLALPALLVLTLAACQGGPDGAAADAEMYTADQAVEMEATSAPLAADAARIQSAAQVDAPIPVERQLIKTGAVSIRADDHAEAAARTRAYADALGGFVGDEQSQRLYDRVETTLTLRVPSARFDTLLALVSALPGEVESRTVSVDDVTRQVADVEARLAARRAAEAQFLEILQRAGSIPDVLAVQVELQRVREEIESAEAQLRSLRDQVALSTLRVTVFEASAAGITSGPGFVSRIGRAIATGWDGLLELTLGMITVWPLVLGLGALVAWVVRRRRRRRTTDDGPRTTPGDEI